MTRNSSRKAVVSLVVAVTMVAPGLMAGPSQAEVLTLSCLAPGLGFGEVLVPPFPGVLPFIPVTSLKTAPNPIFPVDPITLKPALRLDLVEYIANPSAAIQLGKALFWEMQAGSDNKTACATCHFHAGADSRDRNQLHPGANGAWDGYAANHLLASDDYPFTDPAVPTDVDNATGSQGVRKSAYKGLSKSGAEVTTSVADPVFGNARQVTGVNTPSAVNAVFNHRQFWNGRAQPEFNGVNPWGSRDGSARVWVVGTRGPAAVDIRIQTASLASQAVGPALNPVEMSAAGRTFPDLGRKMFAVKPLGVQKVAPTDSVLGTIADTTAGKGLKVSYKGLIQTAFQPKWWNSNKSVTVNGKSYSMMEANFSLFWGLSIMVYEATLVSDDSPMDQYLGTRVLDAFHFDANGLPILVSHDPTRLNQVVDRLAAEGIAVTVEDILKGLALFELPIPLPGTTGIPAGAGAGCALCHVGAETTSASVQHLAGHGLEPGDVAFKNAGFDLRMERMFMKLPPVPAGTDTISYDPSTYTVNVIGINTLPVTPELVETATYDSGWYNLGVRPTAENLGLGGKDDFGNFLSWTQLFQAIPNPGLIKVVGAGLGCVDAAGNPVPPAAPATSPFAGEVLNPLTGFPLLAGPLKKTEATDVAGTFKVPGLRNVELNGPYFHNGGKSTLLQAVELYDEGGNFDNPTKSPLIRPLGMTADQVNALVAFLVSLTDERVRWEKAPFDHPELVVAEGQDANGLDIPKTLPAVGAGGSTTPLPRFLDLNPFQP